MFAAVFVCKIPFLNDQEGEAVVKHLSRTTGGDTPGKVWSWVPKHYI